MLLLNIYYQIHNKETTYYILNNIFSSSNLEGSGNGMAEASQFIFLLNIIYRIVWKCVNFAWTQSCLCLLVGKSPLLKNPSTSSSTQILIWQTFLRGSSFQAHFASTKQNCFGFVDQKREGNPLSYDFVISFLCRASL
jgi:hypothetical protein